MRACQRQVITGHNIIISFTIADSYPVQADPPVLSSPEMYNGEDKFYFRCTIKYKACDADDHSRFEVKFLAASPTRESTIYSEIVTCEESSVVMNEEHLKGNLGRNVCNF